MLDTDFNEFFNSDDDEIFLEASNYPINDLAAKKTELQVEENALHKKDKHFELGKDIFALETSGKNVCNESELTISQTTCENSRKESEAVSPILSEINFSNTSHNPSAVIPDAVSYINSRFTPGFTPKAKKRKFAGPAGLLEVHNETKEQQDVLYRSIKISEFDEFQNIVSSQFSSEFLTLSSWQRLQTAVSSCTSLHSTAEHYSIQRVLHESSKKKLPKHMVVPVLCVLVKKITSKDSTTISVFMDDTGEINGKIDGEVLSLYKDYLIEGTALILKKITFLCNVLIIKPENLVSLYLPNGTEKHLESLDKIFETSEPLKPMNCECMKQSNQNCVKSIIHSCNSNGLKNGSVNYYNTSKDNQNNSLQKKTTYKNPLNFKSNIPGCKVSLDVENMRSDAFLENLLSEEDGIDELLGNLDEKSFMGDM